jgi:hypothetical protein
VARTDEATRPLILRPVVVNDPTRPAMVSALVMLVRRLAPIARRDVAHLLQPTESDPKKAEVTIKLSISLGLVREDEGGRLSAAPELARPEDPLMDHEILTRVFLSAPDGSEESPESRVFGLEAVFYAWLAVEEETLATRSEPTREDLIASFNRDLGLGGGEGINSVKLGHFPDWADFCGLGRRHGTNLGFVCDPTQALDRALDGLWKKGEKAVAAEVFAQRVASALPILDGGASFACATRGRPQPRMTLALTRALETLNASGRLRLAPTGDAPSALALAKGSGLGFDRISRVERGSA